MHDTKEHSGADYRHEMSADPIESSYCSGYTSVTVALKTGPAVYTVRCDDDTHRHKGVACIGPDGKRVVYDIRDMHRHPGGQAPFLGCSRMWPKREFERVRVAQLQARYGKPLPPPPPAPPKLQPPGFKQVAAGLDAKMPPRSPERPQSADREPLRTWTSPEPESGSEANVAPDDGWDDESIPF